MTDEVLVPKDLLEMSANKLSDTGQPHLSEPLFDLLNEFNRNPQQADDQALTMAEKYPAYWKPLPQHWQAIDTYRIDDLFPLASSRLYHARKKLLVPGCRTGGKSVYDDIKEAHATLGAWLADNKPE